MLNFILNCVLPAVVIFISLKAAQRIGYVRGKRAEKYTWRCPECKRLMIADTPQEVLHGSIDHMKEHLGGTVPASEEGSR